MSFNDSIYEKQPGCIINKKAQKNPFFIKKMAKAKIEKSAITLELVNKIKQQEMDQ